MGREILSGRITVYASSNCLVSVSGFMYFPPLLTPAVVTLFCSLSLSLNSLLHVFKNGIALNLELRDSRS